MKIPYLAVNRETFSSDLWRRFCNRYGKNRAQKIVVALSRPVKNFAIRVTLTKTSREKLIETFERLGWKAKSHQLLEEIFTVKTRGPQAIPYLQEAPRITVDKLAAESVLIGSDLFGVGVKKVPKLVKGDTVSIISPKDQIVGIGISKINSKLPKPRGIAVENTCSIYEVPSLRKLGFLDSGDAYSQSIPAAYVAHVLEPKPDETIVDLCAAPGGKSTSAAILSRGKAKIIAFDRSEKRIQKMRLAVARQRLTNITIIKANSIEYLKKHALRADKVIVDPSCTAVGVRPKIYDETTEREIISTSNYQRSFLWAAEKIIRKGGVITYSTCTLEPEENEKIVAYGVQELGLKLVEPKLKMGTNGEDTADGLELEYMRRFYPDQFDAPGFFVAKFTK